MSKKGLITLVSLLLLPFALAGCFADGCFGGDEEEKQKNFVSGGQVGNAGYSVISASVLDDPSTAGSNSTENGSNETEYKFVRVDVTMANLGKKKYTFSRNNFRLVGGSGKEYTETKEDSTVGFFPSTLEKAKSVSPRKMLTVTLLYKIPADEVEGMKMKAIYGKQEDLFDIPIYSEDGKIINGPSQTEIPEGASPPPPAPPPGSGNTVEPGVTQDIPRIPVPQNAPSP